MAEKEQVHILESIPAFALGSLEPTEAERVRRHLAECELCQAELSAYEGVVDALALAAPENEPSPALKSRLMERIGPAPASKMAATVPAMPREQSGLSWWRQAAGALRNLTSGPAWRPVALLLIVALMVGNIVQWQQANQPDPNSWRRIHLTGSEVAPDATGIIYISGDGRKGTVIVDRLAQLPAEQQYQLWLIKDGQRTSGAIFTVDAEGYRGLEIESSQPLQDFTAFGVTIEPFGGSPGPTGERVLGGEVD